MSLKVEQNYVAGIPQTAVLNFAPRGLVWHWTAGATGRAGAQSTINHFVNTRSTVNASYHILLFREGSVTVAMWIVPVSRASHSMNPSLAFLSKTGSARETARFTEVRRILEREHDPNADTISVSFCGMPNDLAVAMSDPGFVADVKELERQLLTHPTLVDRPNFGHGWIQPRTRYETDIAPDGTDLLISKLYDPLVISMEEDMKFRSPIVTQEWDTIVGPASTFIRSDGTTGHFLQVVRVKSIAEGTLNGVDSRLLDYGSAHAALVIPRTGLTNPGVRYVGAQTVENIVEKIVEVPTGITQEQVNAAVELAQDNEQERIALAEAERIRNT